MGHIRIDPPNTNNKWVGFGLTNVDTFIIHVGLFLNRSWVIYVFLLFPFKELMHAINRFSGVNQCMCF